MQQEHIKITIGDAHFDNKAPLALIGGINVLESYELAMEAATVYVATVKELGMPFVFKASFDKANRSSINSFRGPGLKEGLRILSDIKDKFSVPVITDIHEPSQAAAAAEACDALQLPAFLARQTDLVTALAQTNKPINIKKPQFISHREITSIIDKFAAAGNKKLLLCERGNSFGYNNLVVDMLGFGILKSTGYPVVFDVTHSLQIPGGQTIAEGGTAAGGRGEAVFELARAGVSQGIAALFLEAHPDPKIAKCDGPCALALADLPKFLKQMYELDTLIKGLETRD